MTICKHHHSPHRLRLLLLLLTMSMSMTMAIQGRGEDMVWRLNGETDYFDTNLTATHLGIQGNRPKTIEITLMMNAFQHHEGIFSMGGTEANRRDFSLRVNAGRVNHFRGQFWGDDIDFVYDALNSWVHFSVVHDGRSQTIYADGTEVGRQAGALMTAAEGSLKIGFWHAEDTGFLKAWVSELRVWNRALTPTEIRERSHRRLTGREPGLVGYWRPGNEPDPGFVNQVDDRPGRIHGNPVRVSAPFRYDIRQRNIDISRHDVLTLGPVQLRHPVGDARYQWYKDDQPIEGATEHVLELTALTARHAGVYHAEVNDDRPNTPFASSRVRLFDPAWPDGPFNKPVVRYEIRLPPDEDKPIPSFAAVNVWPGGFDADTLQPAVIRADGRRCAADIIWGLSDEPIRIVFDPVAYEPPENKADARRFYLFLGRRNEAIDPVPWNRRDSFILETKNFDETTLQTFDHDSCDAFVAQWNDNPALAGRSLVQRVQHGFPQHRGYGPTPLEYQTQMGAPLALHRYRGYFTVEAADHTRIAPFEEERQALLAEIKSLRRDLAEHNRQLATALAALKKAEETGDQETVRNRRTAATEWQTRHDLLDKQTIPAKQQRLEYVTAAISEIRHNTYTFLTGSKGASWVLVDGRIVTAWPATETLPQRRGKYYGYREGAINLEPGIYRIEYLYAATGSDVVALLLWRRPAQEAPTIMDPTEFTNIGETMALDSLMADGARPVAWHIQGDSRLHGVPDMLLTEFHLPGADIPESGSDEWVYRWQFGDGGSGEGARVEHLYLQSGRYEVTVKAYRDHDEQEPQWQVSQPVHIHVPFDLQHYIESDVMHEHMIDKDFNGYPLNHVLTALRAVEQLDPERISYPDWRGRVIHALSARADELAAISADWTVRAGDIAMCPTVAHYRGALDFYRAAGTSLPIGETAWRQTRIKEARALVLAFGQGDEALDILRSIERPDIPLSINRTDVKPRAPRDGDEATSREWNIAWVEALMAAGDGPATQAFVSAWRSMMGDIPAEQVIRQSARFRRIRSLIENGGDVDLLTAMDLLDDMLRESPERLIAPEFNLMMLDMYLGRNAFTVAYHQTCRLLNLDLNPVHRAEVMARRVIALCGMRDIEAARREFDILANEFPYSEGLRDARQALEHLDVRNRNPEAGGQRDR